MSSVEQRDHTIFNRKKKPIGKIYREDLGKSEYESFYENISGSIAEDLQSASGKLQLEGGGRNKSGQKKSGSKPDRASNYKTKGETAKEQEEDDEFLYCSRFSLVDLEVEVVVASMAMACTLTEVTFLYAHLILLIVNSLIPKMTTRCPRAFSEIAL